MDEDLDQSLEKLFRVAQLKEWAYEPNYVLDYVKVLFFCGHLEDFREEVRFSLGKLERNLERDENEDLQQGDLLLNDGHRVKYFENLVAVVEANVEHEFILLSAGLKHLK